MNIFGIGLPEMAVIAAIALIVFGPKRLPEMGKTLGRTLKGFQSASQEFEQEFRSALRTAEEETSSPSTAAIAPAAVPSEAVDTSANAVITADTVEPEPAAPTAPVSQPPAA